MSQYDACPKCGNEDWGNGITGGDLEQDGYTVWKAYECECGFSWQEIFEFVHNEDMNCNVIDENGDPTK